jgi:putative transposase
MSAELASLSESCGRTGVVAKQKKKFKVTTDSTHNLPVALNLQDRNFETSSPDRVYCSDITYIWTNEGWLYLAVVFDLFSRRQWVLVYEQQDCDEVGTRCFSHGCAASSACSWSYFHSDRGSQYCSKDFQNVLKNHGMLSSMSRNGDCWDK